LESNYDVEYIEEELCDEPEINLRFGLQEVSGTILSRHSCNSVRSIQVQEKEEEIDELFENDFNWDKNMMDEP